MPSDIDFMPIDPKRAAEFLRDEMMTVIRAEIAKPWKAMNEEEQEWCAARVEGIAKAAVVHVCDAISRAGTMAIPATMGKLSTDKDGSAVVPVTFHTELTDEEKLGIWDHIKRKIVVVLMDPAEYQGIENKVDVEPDQPTLPVDQPGQPEWPTVAEAMRDAPDAGDVEGEPAEVDASTPVTNLLDDDMDEGVAAKMIDLKDPTKKKAAGKK